MQCFTADVKCGHVGQTNAKGDALYIFFICQNRMGVPRQVASGVILSYRVTGLDVSVIINDSASCYVRIVSPTDEWKGMEKCWNDTDRVKSKYSIKTCPTVALSTTNSKSHTQNPKNEPGSPL